MLLHGTHVAGGLIEVDRFSFVSEADPPLRAIVLSFVLGIYYHAHASLVAVFSTSKSAPMLD